MSDEEAVRILYRGFAMCGLLIRGTPLQDVPDAVDELVDAMMHEPTDGIAAIKPKKRYDRT